jgi:hypothetical protein
MAEKDGTSITKDFHSDIPFARHVFNVKGADNLDWGMKDRLSRIFNPRTGRTVMLAFDHGYIMGATTGLERLDLVIPNLAEEVDCLMATRGALRSCIPPYYNKGIALRCSAGSSVLDEDMSHEVVAVDIKDAIRMNASCMAIQTFIGSAGQISSIDNLCKTIDAGNEYGIPTLGSSPWVSRWKGPPSFSCWRRAWWLSLERRLSKPTTAKVLKKLPLPARSPWSSRGVRKCPKLKRWIWPTGASAREQPESIWAAIYSRLPIRKLWHRQLAKSSTTT